MITTLYRLTLRTIMGGMVCGIYFAFAGCGAPPQSQNASPNAKPVSTVRAGMMGTNMSPISPFRKRDADAVSQGKKVYADNKCADCHVIAGNGTSVGPDLTHTGADPKHTLAWLEAEIQNPKSHDSNGFMPAYQNKIKGEDLSALAAYLASLK